MDKLVTIKYLTNYQWSFWNSTHSLRVYICYNPFRSRRKVWRVYRRLHLAFILPQHLINPDYESLRSKGLGSLLHLQLRASRFRSIARLTPDPWGFVENLNLLTGIAVPDANRLVQSPTRQEIVFGWKTDHPDLGLVPCHFADLLPGTGAPETHQLIFWTRG